MSKSHTYLIGHTIIYGGTLCSRVKSGGGGPSTLGQGPFDMGGYAGHLHVQSLDWTGGLGWWTPLKSLFFASTWLWHHQASWAWWTEKENLAESISPVHYSTSAHEQRYPEVREEIMIPHPQVPLMPSKRMISRSLVYYALGYARSYGFIPYNALRLEAATCTVVPSMRGRIVERLDIWIRSRERTYLDPDPDTHSILHIPIPDSPTSLNSTCPNCAYFL